MFNLAAHPIVETFAAYWVFSAIIGGMPVPLPNSSRSYGWLYNALHLLAANVTHAMQNKYGNAVLSPGDSAKLTNVQVTDEGITADSATIKKAIEPPQA